MSLDTQRERSEAGRTPVVVGVLRRLCASARLMSARHRLRARPSEGPRPLSLSPARRVSACPSSVSFLRLELRLLFSPTRLLPRLANQQRCAGLCYGRVGTQHRASNRRCCDVTRAVSAAVARGLCSSTPPPPSPCREAAASSPAPAPKRRSVTQG